MLRDVKALQRDTKCEAGEQVFSKVSCSLGKILKKDGSENYYDILKRPS